MMNVGFAKVAEKIKKDLGYDGFGKNASTVHIQYVETSGSGFLVSGSKLIIQPTQLLAGVWQKEVQSKL